MGKYLKEFTTHAEYESYINGGEAILPNVSTCDDQPTHVHYNPYVEPVGVNKLTVTYGVKSTSEDTALFDLSYGSSIVGIEIDGVELQTVQNTYRFNTTGEHVVKYTLNNPAVIDGNCFKPASVNLYITKFEVPETITYIGYYSFNSSENKFDIVVYSTTPPSVSFNICDIKKVNNIYVPAESVDEYKNTEYWSTYRDKIVAIP